MQLQRAVRIDEDPCADLDIAKIVFVGQDQVEGLTRPASLTLAGGDKIHPDRARAQWRGRRRLDLAQPTLDEFENIDHGRIIAQAERGAAAAPPTRRTACSLAESSLSWPLAQPWWHSDQPGPVWWSFARADRATS